MASISPTTFPPSSTCSDANPNKNTFHNPKLSSQLKQSSPSSLHILSLSRAPVSSLSRCHSSSNSDCPYPSDSSSSVNRGWDSAFQEVLRSAVKRFDEFLSSRNNDIVECEDDEGREREAREEEDVEEWDWERWRKHFSEVDEQERVVSILKSHLTDAVNREDYDDASRLKVAIAAAATNDVVGRVMSQLNRLIEEEQYQDAAFVRDFAGAGLVGWWSGISEDADGHGIIVRISAEHGRYVARSYSPRQLATATAGPPLFEIFLTINKRGEYKQQAVYLRRIRAPRKFPLVYSKTPTPPVTLGPFESTEKIDLLSGAEDTGDGEDEDDDTDIADRFSSFDNILRDMIPGLKVKVLKVTFPGKVDRDMLAKAVEQMEEKDEEKENVLESVDEDSEDSGDGDKEQNGIEMDTGGGILDGEERGEIAVKVVLGDLLQNLSDGQPHNDVTRLPAKLEKRGHLSFSFSIENDDSTQVTNGKGRRALQNKKAKLSSQRGINNIMSDLSNSIGKGKIPKKSKLLEQVLKDVSELLNLTLNQARNHQVLTGSTTFSRIEIPSSSDPLNGLYIGTHGLYTSEVIQLRRKFGQWKANDGTREHQDLEFYEYVEAVKLIGDPFVPAGQVAFRAKVEKRYQLPHKGIIPEEFGVIARYKGQGRLAEPGFKNPRWVDGELVVLDGKYIKGGPVVGFIYWAPEFHFLVFFNRLRLQE